MRWLADENTSGPAIQFLRDAGFEVLGEILSADTGALIGYMTVATLDGLRRRPLPSS